MSAGTQPSKADIDSAITSIGTGLNNAIVKATRFKFWLDGIADAELTTLGYNAADIANLRSTIADLGQLSNIYEGLATLAVVKDFRTFLRRVWGFGFSS
jgi:hypothetical protein